ncbi:MAG: hypothetical protein Q4D53_05375, partial [Leptotrichiaceae bacterium]|nr:hypothetical protein [Leptotrichiaceae bacterium]
MTIIEKIKKILPIMKKGVERFPITVLFSIATFGLFSHIIRISDFKGWETVPDWMWKLTVLLILGIPITATLELIREKYFSDKNIVKMRIVSFIITSGLLFFIKIIYLSREKIEDFLGLFFIGVISCLLFFLVPVINRKNDGEKYIQSVVLNIVVTVTFSATLYLGIVAIIGAIDLLLVDIRNSIYLQSF